MPSIKAIDNKGRYLCYLTEKQICLIYHMEKRMKTMGRMFEPHVVIKHFQPNGPPLVIQSSIEGFVKNSFMLTYIDKIFSILLWTKFRLHSKTGRRAVNSGKCSSNRIPIPYYPYRLKETKPIEVQKKK